MNDFILRFTLLLALLNLTAANCLADSTAARAVSPNGKVCIELSLRQHEQAMSAPHWSVSFNGQAVILPSPLSVGLSDAPSLGGNCRVDSVRQSVRREEYDVFPGKRRHVLNHYAEAVVYLREQTPPARRWELVLRATDDGAAFQYRFPAQAGWTTLVITDEQTRFVLPKDAQGYALPLNSFTSSSEGFYQKKSVAEIPKAWLMGLPFLIEMPPSATRPARLWAAITEANLTDYAGMYLSGNRKDPAPKEPTVKEELTVDSASMQAAFISRLSPLPKEPTVAVRAALPHRSPWRIVMVAEDAARLIESDLVFNLSDACAIADPAWIRTGKTTFPWWNGYYLEHVAFKAGQNTATHKHYIDFCAANRIAYHSLDGLDNVAWYGGTIVPYTGASITESLPEIDLPELLRYAKQKGVRLRLWMHWEAAQKWMDTAFPIYKSWGIEGIMIDFIDRDDQEMMTFLRTLLRKAAENELTVTMHGSSKPTGVERTYPNFLTSEGVLNLEHDKWGDVGCPPEHELTVPFTRMLAGALDFHQGSFRGVSVETYKPRNAAPVVIGSPSRTLASYVVYQNHLPMVADYPEAYRQHSETAMLARIPSSWDDTQVVSGSVGEFIVMARRQGETWYVGAMNDRRARAVDVPLAFLGAGRYLAEIYTDDAKGKAPRRSVRRTQTVTSREVLKGKLVAAGGYFLRLTPLK